jgi:hypothetical protein
MGSKIIRANVHEAKFKPTMDWVLQSTDFAWRLNRFGIGLRSFIREAVEESQKACLKSSKGTEESESEFQNYLTLLRPLTTSHTNLFISFVTILRQNPLRLSFHLTSTSKKPRSNYSHWRLIIEHWDPRDLQSFFRFSCNLHTFSLHREINKSPQWLWVDAFGDEILRQIRDDGLTYCRRVNNRKKID